MNERIENIEQFAELWTRIYKTNGKPGWSHILPYYHDDIIFHDSIQEIRGIKEFTAMTKRLTERSKELEFIIHHKTMDGNIIFMEWEMILRFKHILNPRFTAKEYASHGANLPIVNRNEEKSKNLCREISQGSRGHADYFRQFRGTSLCPFRYSLG